MKTEKEIIQMKNNCIESQRKLAEQGINDPIAEGFILALHWILMPSEVEE